MTALNEKAMLVGLSISVYSASKKAKPVEKDAALQHGAKEDRISARKATISKEALAKIGEIVGEARQYHYQHTLPWSDEGPRILAAKLYLDYTKEMAGLRARFDRAVADFCQDYPTYIDEARNDLGTLFNEGDYPRVDSIANKFKFGVNILPMPSGADFRVALSDGEENRVRQEIDAKTQEGVQAGMKDLYSRLHTVTNHMVTKLKEYTPAVVRVVDGKHVVEEKATGVFRDSLVENVRELVGLLPALNIAGDENLEKIRVKLDEELSGIKAEDLRDDDLVRSNVARTAEEVLEAMSGYVG